MTSTILPNIAPGITTRWQPFDELSALALYELLRFRQQIFVVEQRSPYPDLDGLDQAGSASVAARRWRSRGLFAAAAAGRDHIADSDWPVAIAAGHRRRGLGRKLMAEALSFCRQHYSGQPIGLSAQLQLARFYESFGFITVGQPYEDFGVAHVEMEHSELA